MTLLVQRKCASVLDLVPDEMHSCALLLVSANITWFRPWIHCAPACMYVVQQDQLPLSKS